MRVTKLRKENILYRFEQHDNGEKIIIGEKKEQDGITYCIYAEIVDKQFGNCFYRSLLDDGFKRVK